MPWQVAPVKWRMHDTYILREQGLPEAVTLGYVCGGTSAGEFINSTLPMTCIANPVVVLGFAVAKPLSLGHGDGDGNDKWPVTAAVHRDAAEGTQPV